MNRSAKTKMGGRPQKKRNSSPDVDVDIRPGRSKKRNNTPPKVKLKLKGVKSAVVPEGSGNKNSDTSNNSRGLRRSPRRQRQITAQDQKPISPQISKNKLESIAVAPKVHSSTFTSFRIPKKSTNCDNNAKNDRFACESSGAFGKNQGQQQQQKPLLLPMKTQPAPRDSSVASSSSESDKSESKDRTLVDKSLTSCSKQGDDDTPQTNRHTILKAKRRLIQPSATNSHYNKIDNLANPTLKTLPSLNQTFEDLPDYEDSVADDEEDVDLNNPMHNIFKMVKHSSSTNVAQPQNPVLPEVTAMDVDMDLPLILPNEKIIVVPDTNIWINDLRLIETLVNKEFGKPLLIIIPWMVLQELDVGLHQKIKHVPTSYTKMKKPIKYIQTLLAGNHPRVQGQKAYEAAISKLTFDELVADDSILNCVFQNLKSNKTVIFLTNDTNLLNKALVNGILATNGSSALKTLNDVITSSKTDHCGTPIPTATAFVTEPPTLLGSSNWPGKRRFGSSDGGCDNDYIFLDINNDVEMQEDSETNSPLVKVKAVGQPFSSIKSENEFQAIETALLKAFSYIIRRKMIEDYGMGGWEYALKIKPPWTLANALKCMSVHWIANFSYVFTNRGQKHLDQLILLVANYKSSRTNNRKDVEEIIDSSISLFNFLDKEFETEETVVECKRVLLERF